MQEPNAIDCSSQVAGLPRPASLALGVASLPVNLVVWWIRRQAQGLVLWLLVRIAGQQ